VVAVAALALEVGRVVCGKGVLAAAVLLMLIVYLKHQIWAQQKL
jgi:hypothetical protein